jgi:phosphate transport system protein
MTREILYTKMEEIENDVLDMGTLCIDAIDGAVKSFINNDVELAKKIRKSDNIIDLKEMEIEEKCVSIIALQQPVASDLRTILTVIKLISKLEKIGDNASKIAKTVVNSEIKENNHLEHRNNEILQVMDDYLRLMLKDALVAFKTRNESLAREVYNRDKKIDKLFNELYRSMISHIIESPKNITLATEIIFVGKYLERSGNLIASIGDRVVYMITGERIKEEEFDFKHFKNE